MKAVCEVLIQIEVQILTLPQPLCKPEPASPRKSASYKPLEPQMGLNRNANDGGGSADFTIVS
jgi:hypothetical protein